jgi:integrase/recombinase XerD
MNARFTEFLRDKQFLQNVSANTLRWYKHALKWLPSENPADAELKQMVIRMREAGLKETGCNAAIRAINCYLHWASGGERKCDAGCKHPRVRSLKEPQNIMPTFSADQVKKLVSFKPSNAFERRLHLLILLLLDTGCRISEALGIRSEDIDLENMLLTLNGKGRKQRIVAFSFELRKVLYRAMGKGLLFKTSRGTAWGRLNALASVKFHCRKRLGFEPPARTIHSIRHTFATNYVSKTGSILHLQKQLGHASLEMSRRYSHLATADLQDKHVSLLTR